MTLSRQPRLPVVAYLSNQFPSPVEPYVVAEIEELRGRGVEVVIFSARRPAAPLDSRLGPWATETVYLQPLQLGLLLRAAWLCLRRSRLLFDLLERVVARGRESPLRRGRALLHTWLGAYYALQLEKRGVEHIHVHHGYFASWIAMIAARLLGISFSMTLHGSDLLLHPAYLDTKLQHCKFCVTISEFNRRHILEHYPQADTERVLVQRLGVDLHCPAEFASDTGGEPRAFVMLAVGRLHRIKDHAFLIRGCRGLKDRGIQFVCLIAGEGPERSALEKLIIELDLGSDVHLLGHLSPTQLEICYRICDLAVLTSRSEGIPLVLMEAMAHGNPVLAPAITGIPELVIHEKTGFLYRAGSLPDFVGQVQAILNSQSAREPLRRAARQHVFDHFNRDTNLPAFAEFFLSRVLGVIDRQTMGKQTMGNQAMGKQTMEKQANENPILQQI